MTKRRFIGWIAFYAGIALAILVVYLFLQARYAHNYGEQSSTAPGQICVSVWSDFPTGAVDG